MKILHLPLKAEWYNKIEAGLKPEEYREITDYWIRRLLYFGNYFYEDDPLPYDELVNDLKHGISNEKLKEEWDIEVLPYTHVLFRYGYTKRTMLFELRNIEIGKGNPDWGAPDHEVFKLKLGAKIE